jgi:toxin HigB-1
MASWKVFWGLKVQKQIIKLPGYVIGSFYDWVKAVELEGMEKVRRLPGYHDEKLSGEWEGFRSIRLTKAYRVFYFEFKKGEFFIAQVVKVSKHEYKN